MANGVDGSSSGLLGASFRELSINQSVNGLPDFPDVLFFANDFFFKLLQDYSEQLIDDGIVHLNTGTDADISSIGGQVALQFNIQTNEAVKRTLEGLANTGLKNQNKLLSKN